MTDLKPSSVAAEPTHPSISYSPKIQFVISQREPLRVPQLTVDLPAPPQPPGQPPSLNLLTTILPAVLMLIGAIVMTLIGLKSGGGIGYAAIPMILMSLGFPAANLISNSVQKKKYLKLLESRESEYKTLQANECKKLDRLVQEQRLALEREYPSCEDTASIAFNRIKRLWWRRPGDLDFLYLHIGSGYGPATFTVNPPRNLDPNDPLTKFCLDTFQKYQQIDQVPFLVPLLKIGSLAISCSAKSLSIRLVNRLLLEIIVHHSPQDIHLAVLSNFKDTLDRWGWLKWAPHTAAFDADNKPHRLNFSQNHIEEYIHWLSEEFNRRSTKQTGASTSTKSRTTPGSIIVLLDDDGVASQSPEIARIAEAGHQFGIYLIFSGNQKWPRECRARIQITNETEFHYLETWDSTSSAVQYTGQLQLTSTQLCEKVARALSALEVVGANSNAQLPESIRLTQVIGRDALEVDRIKEQWVKPLAPEDHLRFPIGVFCDRTGLEPFYLDLRPEGLGGHQAFHTVLIGTTGSGKSVFMQSMILAAGFYYSPRYLNFMLMDFKAGASELGKLKELPHVVGMVTDLNAEMAARALVAVDSEIQRRKRTFNEAGNISDIWAFNKRFPDHPIPHLVLVLDEFAKGIEILPDLQRVLQTLATQGRALGVYLLLANQKVTSAVESLLANVGWRIVLRVGEKDEMRIVDHSLQPTSRPGRGYIRVKEEIREFQGSRSDQVVQKNSALSVDKFHIYSVEPNGELRNLYTHNGSEAPEKPSEASKHTELEALTSAMIKAQQCLNIQPARQIYLDPLPDKIDLEEILSESAARRLFDQNQWKKSSQPSEHMIAPLGFTDIPEESLQEILEIDFNKQDGHMWIIGAPGSGKSETLISLVLSLSLTHTPEELQIYILEFGSGSLRNLNSLPHVGAVIQIQERERLQRLIAFFDAQINKRTSRSSDMEIDQVRPPDLFLIIQNFAEMRTTYPDEADHISRYIRDGKSAGIHCVITTNRGAELSRAISSNISRRLVLQLASWDEYVDVIGRVIAPLNQQTTGRGYWVDTKAVLCQIAETDKMSFKSLIKEMDRTWEGSRPQTIGVMPEILTYREFITNLDAIATASSALPIGVSYESLEKILLELKQESQLFLVLGPHGSGKSNLLACISEYLITNDSNQWDITWIGLRKSILSRITLDKGRFHPVSEMEKVGQSIQELLSKMSASKTKRKIRYMLFVDDMSSLLDQVEKEVLDSFSQLLKLISDREDLFLIGTGLQEDLRNHAISPLIKAFRQNRAGLVFSKDAVELDWLGAQLPIEYRKIEMPSGRGFLLHRGKPVLVQTPLWGVSE